MSLIVTIERFSCQTVNSSELCFKIQKTIKIWGKKSQIKGEKKKKTKDENFCLAHENHIFPKSSIGV